MKKLSTTLLVSIFALGLTACGSDGGSGDSDSGSSIGDLDGGTTVSTFTITADTTSYTVEELTSTEVNFSFSNADGDVTLSYSPIGGATTDYTVAVSGNSATITTADVDSDESVSVLFTATDNSGATATETVKLTITNTSLANLLKEVEAYQANKAKLLGLTEEIQVIETLSKVAYYSGLKTGKEADAFVESAELAIDEGWAYDLSTSLSVDYAAQVSSGTLSEDGLESALSKIKSDVYNHSQGINEVLASSVAATSSYLDAFTVSTGFVYDEATGSVSQFWGNPSIGSYNELEEFVVKDEYNFIELVVFPDRATCSS